MGIFNAWYRCKTKRVKKLYIRNDYTEFSQEIPQELIQNNIECYLRKVIK